MPDQSDAPVTLRDILDVTRGFHEDFLEWRRDELRPWQEATDKRINKLIDTTNHRLDEAKLERNAAYENLHAQLAEKAGTEDLPQAVAARTFKRAWEVLQHPLVVRILSLAFAGTAGGAILKLLHVI